MLLVSISLSSSTIWMLARTSEKLGLSRVIPFLLNFIGGRRLTGASLKEESFLAWRYELFLPDIRGEL